MASSSPNFTLRALRWLGSNERAILFALAAITVGISVFAEIADQVVDGGTDRIDHVILLSMRQPGTFAPRGPEWLQVAGRDITALGGVTVLGMVTVFTACFLALNRQRRMAFLVLSSVVSGSALGWVLKHFFARQRPDIVPYMVAVSSSSFPSGHSMMSAVTYLSLGALLARSYQRKSVKAYFLCVALLLTILVGVSRVYMGVHWPSDVVAGWTAGSVWALVCWLVARRLQHAGTLEKEKGEVDSPPPVERLTPERN